MTATLLPDATGADRHLLIEQAPDGRIVVTVADDHDRSLSVVLSREDAARVGASLADAP